MLQESISTVFERWCDGNRQISGVDWRAFECREVFLTRNHEPKVNHLETLGQGSPVTKVMRGCSEFQETLQRDYLTQSRVDWIAFIAVKQFREMELVAQRLCLAGRGPLVRHAQIFKLVHSVFDATEQRPELVPLGGDERVLARHER